MKNETGENPPHKTGWIRCKDKLPADGQECLVKSKHGKVREAIYLDDQSEYKGWSIDVTNEWWRHPSKPVWWKPIQTSGVRIYPISDYTP